MLDSVADGGSGPFLDNTTFLAYDFRSEDLERYPTGFNVTELLGGGDLRCATLGLESAYLDGGMQDVSVDHLDRADGHIGRVSGRIMDGGDDLHGATYVVQSGGHEYQLYFETLWELREGFRPVFDAIVSSLTVTAPASGDFHRYPHDAPDFEARMPHRALGRPLCVWSVRGAAIWGHVGKDRQAVEVGILADMGLTVDSLTLAVAGRSRDEDPPYIVTACEYAGGDPGILLSQFDGWPGSVRTVGGRTAFVTESPNVRGHAEGLLYLYPVENVIYEVMAADERWAEDVLDQVT